MVKVKEKNQMNEKMQKVIDQIEQDLKDAEAAMRKSKDEPLQADVLKTIKAMGYEKLKALSE